MDRHVQKKYYYEDNVGDRLYYWTPGGSTHLVMLGTGNKPHVYARKEEMVQALREIADHIESWEAK